MNNDEYKKGYREGFKDGFDSVNNKWVQPQPYPYDPKMTSTSVICSQCGMKWGGVMGYVCPNGNCPIQPKTTC